MEPTKNQNHNVKFLTKKLLLTNSDNSRSNQGGSYLLPPSPLGNKEHLTSTDHILEAYDLQGIKSSVIFSLSFLCFLTKS